MSSAVSRCAAASAFIVVSAFAVPAFAIPSNPDPLHTAAATPWSSVPIGGLNPAIHAHQHWNANPLPGVAGKFKTYAAWDNNTFRYNAAADRPLSFAMDGRDYGHGFMQNAATFSFSPGDGTLANPPVPIDAQNWFTSSVGQWIGNVNQSGIENPNMVPTESLINWNSIGVGQGGDIVIRFARTYSVGASFPGGPGEHEFPQESEIGPDGTWGGNPGGGAGAGISGTLAYWAPALRVLTFNANINWYFTDPMNPLNDFDPTHFPARYDFPTVALHEFGHVLGLDHPDMAMLNTTMQPTLPRRGGLMGHTGIFRNIDGDTVDGARSLYTIAVPAPGAVTMLGGLGALCIGRRRRAPLRPDRRVR